jgi:hypothetical protein
LAPEKASRAVSIWCLVSVFMVVTVFSVSFLVLLYSCIDFSKCFPALVRRYFCKRQLGLSGIVYSIKPAFRSSGSALHKLPLSCLCPKAATISADDRGASAHDANKMRRLTCAPTCAPTCASTCACTVGVTCSVTAESLVEEFLEDGACVREGKWTQSIAIGSENFVKKTKQEFGIRAKDRKVVEAGTAYQLREPQVAYSANFGLENDDIGAENTYSWDVY